MNDQQASADHYRVLWENAGNAILVGDPNGNVIDVNKKAELLFGYSRQEFLQLHFTQLHPPGQLERIKNAFNRHLLTGLSDTEFDTEIIRKDRTVLACNLTGSSIKYSNTVLMQAILVDNSEMNKLATDLALACAKTKEKQHELTVHRERSNKEIQKSMMHFQTLFENAPIPIWVEDFSLGKKRFDELSENGVVNLCAYLENNSDLVWELSSLVKIIDVNQTCVDFFEAGNKKEYVRCISKYFTDKTFEIFRKLLINLASGKMTFNAETPVLLSSGEEKIMLMHMAVVPGYETTLGRILVAFTDITDKKREEIRQKKLKEEIRQKLDNRTAELEKINAQLLHAEKMNSLGKLAANIAHEFGSPIYGIRNILLSLKEHALVHEGSRDILALGIEECYRLEALLTDLQNFNKPTTGNFVRTNIERQIDRMLLLSRKKFMEKKIVITTDYAADLPQIKAVPDQIKQVILNLLNNAVEAMPVEGGSIQVVTEKSQNTIAVHIYDSGCGIRPEDYPFVFEPFFSKKPGGKGTGLGLSVSLGIVQKHGGKIRINSKPGSGTLVSLFLPIDRKSDSETTVNHKFNVHAFMLKGD